MAKAASKPKSDAPGRAAIWDKFARGVAALAKDLNVPQEFELKKVREKGKPRGDAWKDWERAYAKLAVAAGFTKAHRISRGDDLGESDVDVALPEAPQILIDTKYQVDGWSVQTLFEKNEAKYIRPGSSDFFVMPLKGGQMSGNKGSVSVIRTEKLLELMATVFLRGKATKHALSCPLCPGALWAETSVMGLATCRCTLCDVELQMPAAKIPRPAWGAPSSLMATTATSTVTAPPNARQGFKKVS